MKGFGKELIKWYGQHKRSLPWRETRDPYAVWLSEIILQQTRVDQGLAYYHKFLELFPDVHALANAKEDDVLKAWQGLGYYSRARNLHITAKTISSFLFGEFPNSASGLLLLKGIGPYTAAAIASFCFDEVAPVIDGNVIRVLSRIFAIEFASDSREGKAAIKQLAEELIEKKSPAQYNQAIMEFGAIWCTPHQPKCEDCPFQQKCGALLQGRVKDFPIKTKKTKVQHIWFGYFVIHQGTSTFIQRRDSEGIWRGLYDFPLSESAKPISVEEHLAYFSETFRIKGKFEVMSISEEIVHVLSHRKIHTVFIEIQMKGSSKFLDKSFLKIETSELNNYGIPRLLDKYLRSHPSWKKIMA